MADTPNGLRMAPPKTKADALTSGSVMASIAQMDDSERSKLMAELKGEMEPDPEDEEDGTEGDKCKDKKADPACAASAVPLTRSCRRTWPCTDWTWSSRTCRCRRA